MREEHIWDCTLSCWLAATSLRLYSQDLSMMAKASPPPKNTLIGRHKRYQIVQDVSATVILIINRLEVGPILVRYLPSHWFRLLLLLHGRDQL